MSVNNLRVNIGDSICPYKPEYQLGFGVYNHNNHIYSSTVGTVSLETLPNGQTPNAKLITVKNNIQNKSVSLNLGDELVCRVFRIREQAAWVKVLQINEHPVTQHLEGIVKREYVREKEIDSVKMEECYIPGDIIRAKFISFGDGRRIYLSTAAEKYGVLYAKSSTSGKLMLPFSWTEMICMKTGVKESRKVAKPEKSDIATTAA